MKKLLSGISLMVLISAQAQSYYLKACWKKQVMPLGENYLLFNFSEELNTLEHSFEPWQQTLYNKHGSIAINATCFQKTDTMMRATGKRSYYSKLQLTPTELLWIDYGDNELSPVSKGEFLEQSFKTARYAPQILIQYFLNKKIEPDPEKNPDYTLYTALVNQTRVTLFIGKTDRLLHRVTTLEHDDLFGDVTTTYFYENYINMGKLFYPQHIKIEKINGQLKDEINILSVELVPEPPNLLKKPANFQFAEKEKKLPEVTVEKYAPHIYLVNLAHTDDRVLVVEFNEFFLVAEAPLNSENGELIIGEVKKIAPHKPIQYFVFGHYHPHYLGGIRAFIHQGARIICTKSDEAYVTYLAQAPHTLQPDSLQLQPQPLQIEEMKDSLVIGDKDFQMKIYFIGEKSAHTHDYLIYYFPAEKLLFEDDLVWIPKEKPAKESPPSDRQIGLYNAIKELNLDVKTIIQSWPVNDYGAMTIIPMEALEKSIQKK